MKTTLFVMLLMCTAAAFGQNVASIPSQPQIPAVPEHVLHADLHEMATAQYLVGGSSNTYGYAQGERPLWEFGPVSEPTPLGDIARAVRKEKLAVKKAEIVFEKQGS